MLQDKDAERSQKVMQAMLQMKKLDIAGLEAAHRQR
jgi:predicted 3-demethylubiquinone-9 3-methyltransferase (glyoxalase superfamily)